MGESKVAVTFHLTEHEQGALGRALLRAEASSREARAKKKRAMGSVEEGGFGLDWVREATETPVEGRLSSEDLLSVYQGALERTGTPAAAMGDVVRRVAASFDAFAGRHGKAPIKVTPDRDLVAWLLETLDKLPVARNQQTGAADTSDDLVLADIEERIVDARQGTYRLPDELRAAPPALDIVPEVAAST